MDENKTINTVPQVRLRATQHEREVWSAAVKIMPGTRTTLSEFIRRAANKYAAELQTEIVKRS